MDKIRNLPAFITRQEMAEVLNVTPATIRRWSRAGKITERLIKANLVEVEVASVVKYRFPGA